MAEPPGRAARPDTGSSVAPVMAITGAPCVRGLGTTIAPGRRAMFRQPSCASFRIVAPVEYLRILGKGVTA